MALRTSTIDIETPGGTADAFVAAPSGRRHHPGVLLFMDAFGLRPRLEEMACRLADEGYVVLVPNVFHRGGRSPLVDPADLLDADRREALVASVRQMAVELTPERAMGDAEAYLAFLRDHDQVTDHPVGTVGYCMGVAIALRTAAHAPDDVAAVAGFHGGHLVTDGPDSPHLLVDRLRSEVYLASADQDASMTAGQQQTMADALTGARVTHVCEQYDGAPHGFTMADTAAYDEGATERHWAAMTDLFARTLR